MTARRLIPLLVLAVLPLAACSGGGGAPSTPMATDSPLTAYLAPLDRFGGDDADQRAAYTTMQTAIAQCMTEQGFEYIPLPYDPDADGYRDEFHPDDRGWVEQWGYGVVDFPNSVRWVTTVDTKDVNSPYYDSLGSAEQLAYAYALWGEPVELDPNGGGPTWQQEGCNGVGSHTAYGDGPQDVPEVKALWDQVLAFQRAQPTAPEYDGLNAEWAACMAEKGHPGFTRQADAKESIFDEAVQLRTASDVDLPPTDPSMTELQQREIELALADLDCREQTDYPARSLTIQYAQEEQFIADHKAELDAMIATVQQASAG